MHELLLEKFSGPLDLLLNMVEEKKLSVNEISLSEVAEQYIRYLRSLERMPKEELAAFLVIASTLMLIKSRSLMPSLKLTEEEEMDIKELKQRLKLYKFFKEISLHLRELSRKGRHLFGREAYAGLAEAQIFLPPERIDANLLKNVLEEVLALIPKKDALATDAIKKAVSIEEKMSELKGRLQVLMKLTFDEIKKTSRDKTDTIVSFLAMLELIKQGFLIFEQKQLFGTIEFEKMGKHERPS